MDKIEKLHINQGDVLVLNTSSYRTEDKLTLAKYVQIHGGLLVSTYGGRLDVPLLHAGIAESAPKEASPSIQELKELVLDEIKKHEDEEMAKLKEEVLIEMQAHPEKVAGGAYGATLVKLADPGDVERQCQETIKALEELRDNPAPPKEAFKACECKKGQGEENVVLPKKVLDILLSIDRFDTIGDQRKMAAALDKAMADHPYVNHLPPEMQVCDFDQFSGHYMKVGENCPSILVEALSKILCLPKKELDRHRIEISCIEHDRRIIWEGGTITETTFNGPKEYHIPQPPME